jgi:hypothetical protein
MWVNGTSQTNSFDTTNNPAYRSLEAGPNIYSPGTYLQGDQLGAGFAKRATSYLGMNITDFSYWHAALDNDDVKALYNQGVRAGRTNPTEDFTVIY